MRVRHGGELRAFSEKFGIPERDILDFSSNINPWGPTPSVLEAYEQSRDQLRLYPDPEALEFRREVARHFPLWPENVVAGNGAADLLDLILRLLRPKRALLVEPCFLEYRRLLNLHRAEVRSIALKEGDSFEFSLPELLNSLSGVEVAILANPNNPTGTALDKSGIERFLSEAKRRNVFVILDEAFVDWCPEFSVAREVKDDSSFFVVRSITKFYSLPGIRIGFGLGSRKLVEKLAGYQVPWSTNGIAQLLGIAALRDEEFARRSRQWLAQERSKFENELQEIPGLKVYPSRANFVLVRSGSATEKPLLSEGLGKQGIYVRDLEEFPGLGPAYFRFAVRKREENFLLVESLKRLKGSLAGSIA